MCKFHERIILEVILETYFTLKNFAFLLAEGCNDRTFSCLGKADKMTCFTGAFTQKHRILYLHGFCSFSLLNFCKQWEK